MSTSAYSFNTLLFSTVILLAISCKKSNPIIRVDPPKPEVSVVYECPNDGDIYRIFIDTLIINNKGEVYTTDSTKLTFQYAGIPLGVCEKTRDLYGTAKYSPLSAKVKTAGGIIREFYWDRNGYFKQVITAEEMEQLRTAEEGEKMVFELSLLNFSKDTIQTTPITFIHKGEFSEKNK
jgi:hypothetical protein